MHMPSTPRSGIDLEKRVEDLESEVRTLREALKKVYEWLSLKEGGVHGSLPRVHF